MRKGYIVNIEEETTRNKDYRRVLYTGRYSQLVVMSLRPGEEIGDEVHGLDQFIRIEAGEATVILNNGRSKKKIKNDWAVIVPAGTWHNVINAGRGTLKLYTLYSPPEHRADVVQATKADEREERFKGRTSE